MAKHYEFLEQNAKWFMHIFWSSLNRCTSTSTKHHIKITINTQKKFYRLHTLAIYYLKDQGSIGIYQHSVNCVIHNAMALFIKKWTIFVAKHYAISCLPSRVLSITVVLHIVCICTLSAIFCIACGHINCNT